MAHGKEPKLWGLASASEVGTALRGVRIALTAQDSALKYLAGINAPLSADPREVAGLSDDQLYPGVSHDLRTTKERVSQTGKPEGVDVRLARGEHTDWHRIWVEPLGLNGDGRGVLAASVDITAQKVAEEHLRLALLELAHRSKNLLAVVLSIARQSADESQTLPQFSSRFIGRIHALAVAHDVLTDESWRGATVFSLVRSQLSAFSETADTQSRVEGHNAYLKPNTVQYVGLALHELIAMSLLAGALSAPSGRLVVTTALVPSEDGSRSDLLLRWHETEIPATALVEKSHFGHALLERIVPAAMNGQARLDLSNPDSLIYELRIPAPEFF